MFVINIKSNLRTELAIERRFTKKCILLKYVFN